VLDGLGGCRVRRSMWLAQLAAPRMGPGRALAAYRRLITGGIALAQHGCGAAYQQLLGSDMEPLRISGAALVLRIGSLVD